MNGDLDPKLRVLDKFWELFSMTCRDGYVYPMGSYGKEIYIKLHQKGECYYILSRYHSTLI